MNEQELFMATILMVKQIPVVLTTEGIIVMKSGFYKKDFTENSKVKITAVKSIGEIVIEVDEKYKMSVPFNSIEITDDAYFIRNEKSGYIGNSFYWWKKGGGYNCSINEAAIFNKAAADRIHENRATDIPYKVKDILNYGGLFLIKDVQYI